MAQLSRLLKASGWCLSPASLAPSSSLWACQPCHCAPVLPKACFPLSSPWWKPAEMQAPRKESTGTPPITEGSQEGTCCFCSSEHMGQFGGGLPVGQTCQMKRGLLPQASVCQSRGMDNITFCRDTLPRAIPIMYQAVYPCHLPEKNKSISSFSSSK